MSVVVYPLRGTNVWCIDEWARIFTNGVTEGSRPGLRLFSGLVGCVIGAGLSSLEGGFGAPLLGQAVDALVDGEKELKLLIGLAEIV